MKERLDPSKKKRFLRSLMKISKVYCIVPTSCYVLDTRLKKLGDGPLNEVSNIWAGTYVRAGQDPDGDPEYVSIKVLSRYWTSPRERDTVTEVSVPLSVPLRNA